MRRDLRAQEEVDGTLGYGDARAVANRRHGTITALPAEGAVVTRGHALYRVGGRPGDAVWQPGPLRVSKLEAAVGDDARPGAPLLRVTGTERQVTIDLDASRRPYVRAGDRVDLELPGGRATTGRVASVGKVATVPAGGDGDPTVELVVTLDRPGETGRLDPAPVDASITTEVRKGVLAVPVTALLALAEGGSAVEVERQGRRELVGVKTGLFADGQVEVSGDGLAAGDRVVVPA